MIPVEARVQATGLLDGPVLVLLSGGRDSVCLLHLATRISPRVRALHVDYGLHEPSEAPFCAELCAALGVPLDIVRAGAPEGNVQAWARELRYAEARRRGGTIAVGHTASDQAETVLYRLAASPGRRALLGMREREGDVVRPLLGITRAETTAYCEQHGLAWRDDPTNATPRYTRNRARRALAELHPAGEANVLRTLELLRDEAEVLDALVDEVLTDEQAALQAMPPALARLCLRRLADDAPVAARLGELLALGGGVGSAALDLGGGLRAVAEYGRLRFERGAPAPPPEPAPLAIPGAAAFGGGRVVCVAAPDGPLDLDALRGPATVRGWREGDRMRLRAGTRTLQDLFTDRKVPRARRAHVPVVVSGGEIAWVAGVATAEAFAAGPRTRRRARLDWHP